MAKLFQPNCYASHSGYLLQLILYQCNSKKHEISYYTIPRNTIKGKITIWRTLPSSYGQNILKQCITRCINTAPCSGDKRPIRRSVPFVWLVWTNRGQPRTLGKKENQTIELFQKFKIPVIMMLMTIKNLLDSSHNSCLISVTSLCLDS